jgi:DNA-binding PadR family transcriptional regulator
LLRSLMDAPRKWHHGYELSKATGLASGTLYPILMRLSERGFLEHKWEPTPETGRPPRHVYRLTASGAAYAREQFAISDEIGVEPRRAVSRA